LTVRRMVVVQGQAILLEVVLALHPPRRLSRPDTELNVSVGSWRKIPEMTP
jgi:hypothetical protein